MTMGISARNYAKLYSDLWACSNKMVQVSTDQNRVTKQEIRDLCTCWSRSASICSNEPVCVSEYHVHPRGGKPPGEVVQNIYWSFTEQLDDLAICTGCQFLSRPARLPSAFCQWPVDFLELLS